MSEKKVELIGFIDCELGSYCRKWNNCQRLKETPLGVVDIPVSLEGHQVLDLLQQELNNQVPSVNIDSCTDPENPNCGAPVELFVRGSCYSFRNIG